MAELIGAIDQGTTSTRFMVFDSSGTVVAAAQEEHEQIFPEPGWVEHDPMEIWTKTSTVVDAALDSANLRPRDLRGIGITNQRETTVLWDRRSGEPVANAIVWQDTRTSDICEGLRDAGVAERITATTGLPPATYFSAPKVSWMLDRHDLNDRAARGDIAFGTIDSWLTFKLTGKHVTDTTNASRTMLMDLATATWDSDLALELGIPTAMLAEIRPSVSEIGECQAPLPGVPILSILGDQQAALFGQACFEVGEAKTTYGTGNFILMNVGDTPAQSQNGLLSTVAYSMEGESTVYALEGSVAVTGSLVQWLRDNLGLIESAAEIESLAASVEDNGDVFVVPAFSGLFAPHWRDDARGVIVGLTRFANKGHVARAALESVAYQTDDVVEAMVSDSGVELAELRVDGGMTANDLLMQFQADVSGVDVVRPATSETTAFGAALGAGITAGVWSGLDEVRTLWKEDKRWVPGLPPEDAAKVKVRWRKAVERSLGWV